MNDLVEYSWISENTSRHSGIQFDLFNLSKKLFLDYFHEWIQLQMIHVHDKTTNKPGLFGIPEIQVFHSSGQNTKFKS